jgi:hypothetical protein
LKAGETSGTQIERKTAISRITERPTTRAMKTGRRDAILSARSSKIAVAPPTYTSTAVPAVAAGSTSLRRRSTSLEVRSSCGELFGITLIVAASPLRLS